MTLEEVVDPPSIEGTELVLMSFKGFPPLNHAISTGGLLFDEVQVRVTVSPTLASVGPVIFTSFGGTGTKND